MAGSPLPVSDTYYPPGISHAVYVRDAAPELVSVSAEVSAFLTIWRRPATHGVPDCRGLRLGLGHILRLWHDGSCIHNLELWDSHFRCDYRSESWIKQRGGMPRIESGAAGASTFTSSTSDASGCFNTSQPSSTFQLQYGLFHQYRDCQFSDRHVVLPVAALRQLWGNPAALWLAVGLLAGGQLTPLCPCK